MVSGKYFEEWNEDETYESPWRAISESHFQRFVDIAKFNEPLFENKQFVQEEIGVEDWMIPGWLTASCAMGLFVRSGWFHETVLAILEVNGLRWNEPVIVGDEIKVIVEVTECKETSDDSQGVVTLDWDVVNRDGNTVMEMETIHLMKARTGE